MEILFRKETGNTKSVFLTIKSSGMDINAKTYISTGTFSDQNSIKSYELSPLEVRQLAYIFNKIANEPDFLVHFDSTSELFEEAQVVE